MKRINRKRDAFENRENKVKVDKEVKDEMDMKARVTCLCGKKAKMGVEVLAAFDVFFHSNYGVSPSLGQENSAMRKVQRPCA